MTDLHCTYVMRWYDLVSASMFMMFIPDLVVGQVLRLLVAQFKPHPEVAVAGLLLVECDNLDWSEWGNGLDHVYRGLGNIKTPSAENRKNTRAFMFWMISVKIT